MQTADRRRRSWREDVRHVDLERVGRARRGRRRFREVVEAVGREEHQRVVPLPLAVAAVLVPFLTAWAVAHPGPEPAGTVAASVAERPWDERRPPAALHRERRLPEDPQGYVDLWAAPTEWEVQLLARGR